MSLTKEHTLEVIAKCRAAQLAADDDRYANWWSIEDLQDRLANKMEKIKLGEANVVPIATKSSLGTVIIGDNISVTSAGKISVTKDNITNALGYTPPSSNTTYSVASTSTNGLMSAADKTKLNGIETAAEVNVIETVKVNNTALTVDSNKAVNIDLSAYALKTELGSGQVTLGTASVSTEGGVWLDFS